MIKTWSGATFMPHYSLSYLGLSYALPCASYQPCLDLDCRGHTCTQNAFYFSEAACQEVQGHGIVIDYSMPYPMRI